jgi:hypothetical protein
MPLEACMRQQLKQFRFVTLFQTILPTRVKHHLAKFHAQEKVVA